MLLLDRFIQYIKKKITQVREYLAEKRKALTPDGVYRVPHGSSIWATEASSYLNMKAKNIALIGIGSGAITGYLSAHTNVKMAAMRDTFHNWGSSISLGTKTALIKMGMKKKQD